MRVEIFFAKLKGMLASDFISHCWEVVSKYFHNILWVANYAVINPYGDVCGISTFGT